MPKFTEWSHRLPIQDIEDSKTKFLNWLDKKLVPDSAVQRDVDDENRDLLPAIAKNLLYLGAIVVIAQIILLHLIKPPALVILEQFVGPSSFWLVDGLAWLLPIPLIIITTVSVRRSKRGTSGQISVGTGAPLEGPHSTRTIVDPRLSTIDTGILPDLDIKGLTWLFRFGILLIVSSMAIYGVKGEGVAPYVWCGGLVVIVVLLIGLRKPDWSTKQADAVPNLSTESLGMIENEEIASE